MQNAILKKININYNSDRLKKVCKNDFFKEEIQLLKNQKSYVEYYKYLFDNVDIDKNNEKNSYVLWCLNKVDTLNENRPFIYEKEASLPDIDVDVPVHVRGQVIDYIKDKYGHDKVSQMVTFQSMKGARALKEVFRAYRDLPFEEINRITENIVDEAKISDELEKMENPSIIMWCLENKKKDFQEWCELEDGKLKGPYADRFDQAIKLEGTKTAQSKHAAGVIVSPVPLADVCPMVLDPKTKLPVAGLEMNDLEAIGLMKLDILGIAALSKLMEIKRLNPKFNPDPVSDPMDDSGTWGLISEGNTKGVFQLESRMGQSFSKKLGPENIDHLAALTSLLRPGPLSTTESNGKTVTENFIAIKNKELQPSYLHEALRPILSRTFSKNIFQEQSSRIAVDLAGFSDEEADQYIRKGIGKKKADLIAKAKIMFMKGCQEKGLVNEEDAKQIFASIESSARYQFNACLTDSCMIQLEDGSKKTINNVRVGERVKTPTGYANVVKTYDHGSKKSFKITTESEKRIECTIDHKFDCGDGQIVPLAIVAASRLPLMSLQNGELKEDKIVKIESLGERQVYDIEIDNEDHIFYGNDIATSNSHSYGYSYLTYMTAYAKKHFPKEFFTGYLKYAHNNLKPQKEIYELINNAKSMDIFVKPPNIRHMNPEFELIKGKIFFGLCDVKTVGKAVIDKLEKTIEDNKNTYNKDFSKINWIDFLVFFSKTIKSNSLDALINVGALDCFKETRTKMIYDVGIIKNLSLKELEWVKLNNKSLPKDLVSILEFMSSTPPGRGKPCSNKNRVEKIKGLIRALEHPPFSMDDKPHQIAQAEFELLGCNITFTSIDECDLKYKSNCSCLEFNKGWGGDKDIMLAVSIDEVRTVTTKKGKQKGSEMAFVEASDDTGSVNSIVLFPLAWAEFKNVVSEGNRVLLGGKRTSSDSLNVEVVEQM